MLKMIEKISKNSFFRNSVLYTLGAMMTPLIGVLMLPIYTKYLTTSEYGILTTILMLLGLFQLLFLLGLNGSITRFYYEYEEDLKKLRNFLGTIFNFVFIFSTVIASGLLLFGDLIGGILFKNIPINPYYFYLIYISWITSFWALQLSIFRVQEKAYLFVLLSGIKEVLTAGVAFYLIVYREATVEDILFVQLVVTIGIVLVTFGVQSRYISFTFNKDILIQSLVFGLPLLPHIGSSWVINSFDKVILEKYIDVGELGIYVLATQIAMVMSLFYASINNAMVPRYTKLLMSGNEKEAKNLNRIFLCVILASGVIAIPVATLGIKLFTSDIYQEAVKFIPLLIISQIISGIYFIPVAKLFYLKLTKNIAISSLIAAFSSVILNITLIPFYGVYGAIYSSIIAALIRLLFIYKASLKYVTINGIKSN